MEGIKIEKNDKYFKWFLVLLINSIILYFSYFVKSFYDLLIESKSRFDKDYLICFLVIFFFIHIIKFNVNNLKNLDENFFYKYSKFTFLIFFSIFSIISLYYTIFAFFYFMAYFLYILTLNIIIKNKKIRYYLILTFLTLLGLFLSFISLGTVKQLTYSTYLEENGYK